MGITLEGEWFTILGRENTRSDCLEQVNVTVRQVKIEVQWPDGQVKFASVVL